MDSLKITPKGLCKQVFSSQKKVLINRGNKKPQTEYIFNSMKIRTHRNLGGITVTKFLHA